MDIEKIMNSIDKFNKKNIQVRIAYDNQSAQILLSKPGTGESYTIDEISEALVAAGVKMGIDSEVIKQAIAEANYNQDITVARGKAVEDGQDGYYDYNFVMNVDGKPMVKEDGSVDYYNARKFETVTEGAVVAEYHMPTKGVFGYDVRGKLLAPKPGKMLSPLRGRGFTLSEDGLTYVAAMTGKIEYRNGEITISDVYEVNGDVTIDVGNIDFSGDVKINGNVISGVVINARGSIYIGGYVEGAIIKAGKDIVFNHGVNSGEEGHIEAKGNISGKFFENARVTAGGDIRANYIFNSKVVAKGKVIVEGRKARIIGGDVTGILGIQTGNCGNEANVSTNVRVGVTKGVTSEYASTLIELKEIDAQLETFNNALNRMKNIDSSGANKAAYTKLFQAKIIKSAERAKCEAQAKHLFELIRESNSAGVQVDRVLYPGSRIYIETYIHEPQEKASHVLVRLFDNEVIVRNY